MSIPNLRPYDLCLDTCAFACPLPLLKTKQALCELPTGAILWVISTQPSLSLDLKALLRQTQDVLVSESVQDGLYHFFIQKHLP